MKIPQSLQEQAEEQLRLIEPVEAATEECKAEIAKAACRFGMWGGFEPGRKTTLTFHAWS